MMVNENICCCTADIVCIESNLDEIIPVPRNSVYSRYIKRIIDFSLSLIGVVVLSPLLLVLTVLELIYHGRPVLYVTLRPGKDEKLFNLYKFRSMTNESAEDGELLPEKYRLTKFGKFLRATSLDELPSLFNIIKGDLAIIGPRPLLTDYLELYPQRYRYRHSVRPGLELSPPAGRLYFLTWREQFENDISYVENVSFTLDVKQLYLILKMILSPKNNKVRTDDTRVMFDGTNIDDTRSKREYLMARSQSVKESNGNTLAG
jgi:undecaprenyl phosphate N,N'-diacetylbacillosamine 1-phosphate transferase